MTNQPYNYSQLLVSAVVSCCQLVLDFYGRVAT